MSKPFQLQIPTPCHENWANMQPSDKGRHCAACQKTVVDFTAMSDTGIIGYMSKAGPHVCGRLAADQLNRPLLPLAPPQKNKLPGWPLLLTGIFLTHDKPMSHHPVAQTTHEQSPSPKQVPHTTILGFTIPKIVDTIPKDSITFKPVIVGAMSLIKPDTTEEIKLDSTKMADTTISIKTDTMLLPPTQDVVAGMIVCSRPRTMDTIKQFLADTLSALHLLPQKQPLAPINNELTIYPNPVRRGIPFRLAWQTNPGKYQISLFSSSGALIQQRMIDISSTDHVSDWQVPTNAPAGIYIIRALQPGQTRVYARELIVQ
ncbi:MAG TPA: T9SS type A sorting domain-containing protein [Puia sp.]|jgi:hypothetical protein